MKIFLDANVLFAAALPGSRMAEFLGCLRKHAELASSHAAFDEAARNVGRMLADAAVPAPSLQVLLRSVVLTSVVAEPPRVELVEKDRHILGAAVASGCSHLLTGDQRHFKHLFGKVASGVLVVHAAMLAEELGFQRVPRQITS